MIPPSGFAAQQFPLMHRIVASFGLSMVSSTQNSAFITLVRHTNDIITTGAGVPRMIVTNPKNPNFVKDAGPAVCNMSILDKLSLSLKFNVTENFETDKRQSLKFLWRPVFFSFQEKLLAADEVTTSTVEAILGLTSDTTFEDVVPITTNKLPDISGASELPQAVSTVNIAEVFGDYNMTTNMEYEDHPWNEDTFQNALRYYTNKGALRSMVGNTRHVTLSRNNTYKNFYFEKMLPSAVRRVMPYSFFGIQIYVPLNTNIGQEFSATSDTASVAHLGVKAICHYHEWNNGHYQNPEGVPPTSA